MPSLSSLIDQATSIIADELQSDKRPGQAAFTSTRYLVSFHTDDGYDGAIDSSPDSPRGSSSDIGGFVQGSIAAHPQAQPARLVGVNTGKRFGSSPGTFTLTLKARGGTDVLRLWPDPEDVWVRVVAVKDGKPVEVLFGLLNTVTENLTRNPDGSRNITYTLTGVDWQKVLTSTQLYINIHEHAGDLPMIPLYDALSNAILGTPSAVCEALLVSWLGNNGVGDKQWALPQSLGGGYLFDLLQLDFQTTRGMIKDPALYSPDQMMGKSLWSVLEEYSNGVLNELFATTNDSGFVADGKPKPMLVLRERPFPTKDKGSRPYNALRIHVLAPGDVKTRSMSRGAPESRYNYWLLDAKGIVGDGLAAQAEMQLETGAEHGEPGGAPIYNVDDVRKHGFRRFIQETRYFPFRDDASWYQEAARWLHMLHDWYAVSPFEQNGSLATTSLLPEIRIGDRVVESRADGSSVTYYVEGVTHDWHYPETGATTLNLTRGEYSDAELLAQVYERVDAATWNMITRATGLFSGGPLAATVPTGSGPRLDRITGQLDTPEREFMRRQGALDGQGTNEAEGEPQNPQPGHIERVSEGDLPDQQVSEKVAIATGTASPRPRTQGGNLTQRELEAGIPLPEQELHVGAPETSEETSDQKLARWRKRRT